MPGVTARCAASSGRKMKYNLESAPMVIDASPTDRSFAVGTLSPVKGVQGIPSLASIKAPPQGGQ